MIVKLTSQGKSEIRNKSKQQTRRCFKVHIEQINDLIQPNPEKTYIFGCKKTVYLLVNPTQNSTIPTQLFGRVAVRSPFEVGIQGDCLGIPKKTIHQKPIEKKTKTIEPSIFRLR